MASQPVTEWMIDRQYAIPTMLLGVLGICFTLLPMDYFLGTVPETGAEGSSSGVFRMLWLPLMLLGGWIVLRRLTFAMAFFPSVNLMLLATLGWMLLSSAWAPVPGTALRQAIAVSGIAVIAIAMVITAWQPDRVDRMVIVTGYLIMASSLIVALLIPSVGIHSEDQFELLGSWRGVTYQKNGLGQLSSVMMIYSTYLWASRKLRLRWTLWLIPLSVLLILKSRSSTSLMVSTIASVVLVLLLRPPFRTGRLHGPLIAGIWLLITFPLLLYLLLTGSFDTELLAGDFGSVFGKDASLSGRTYIWAELLRIIPRHPWLGVGFNSFWGPPGSLSDDSKLRLGWDCPNGHNGYLDIVCQVGLVGFALFIGFLIQHGRQLARAMDVDRERAALHVAIFIYILLANLTESGWFNPIQFTYVIAIFSSLSVSRLIFEGRLRSLHEPGPVSSRPAAVRRTASVHMAPRT